MKRIGLLTSGGDAPGMNAAIRAAVRTAVHYGMEVYGVMRGYAGLIDDELVPMDAGSVSNIASRGGTILRTARCLELLEKEGQDKAAATLRKHGIEGLVVIGGDGSFMGAKMLTEQYGVSTIGIPGTIDNDLEYTDYTLGFDTAVNTCIDAVDKLRDTMESHERVAVVEVMGRHCGDIALYTGLATGADTVVLPEAPYDIGEIAARIEKTRAAGKHCNIIIVAEGVMSGEAFAERIRSLVKYDVRATNIGHIQRGGMPTMADRVLGARLGNRAVTLLHGGAANRVVGIRKNEIVDFDIIEAVSMKKRFDSKLYETLQTISM